jgi:2-haloacid dehalogenase
MAALKRDPTLSQPWCKFRGDFMTNDIRHIVFDIGRVLIHYDPDIPFRRIIPDDDERAWFFAHVCTHDWNLEQDRGRSWREAEDLLIAQHPQHAARIRAFRAHWSEMVSHAYRDTVLILERVVKAGWDVTLLTNFAADTFEEAKAKFPFLALPRGATVSGRVRLLKPDPAIYRLHIETFGLDPAATLFTDDSPANISAAREAGWHAVLFTGAGRLRQDFAGFGVEV